MDHTPGPWAVGLKGGVVADTPTNNHILGSDDVEYYGGYLICESVTLANARLIVKVPELLEAAKKVVDDGFANNGKIMIRLLLNLKSVIDAP